MWDNGEVAAALNAWVTGTANAARLPVDMVLFPTQSGTVAPVEVEGDGRFALADWIVPGSHLRGKKARRQRQAGEWVNGWLRYAGVGNGRFLSQAAWHRRCDQLDLQIIAQHVHHPPFFLDQLTAALSLSRRTRLRAMLLQAPPPVVDYLTPQLCGDRISFQLQMIFLLCK
jgi:hypothetical protein